jgi:NAD(P)-dependent dehydrogenase (short-subunit alcohol dehydrogenase family)
MTRPLAVVTGARRGIGAAIAIELARGGFDLALTDIATSGADDTLARLTAAGARAMLFASDLADVSAHAALVERIAAWGGPIACLVNNAGVPAPARGDLLDVAVDAFDRVLDVNLRGTFFFTQAVARHMAAQAARREAAEATASNGAANGHANGGAKVHGNGGATRPARSIVTVSSVSAEAASIERGEYCLSKAGLGMLTKLFALRLAPLDIGVFEVRPGIIRTPMTEGVAAKYDERIAGGLVPQGRWGTPEDVLGHPRRRRAVDPAAMNLCLSTRPSGGVVQLNASAPVKGQS